MKKFIMLLATVGGAGKSPIAPGSVGTLAGMLMVSLVHPLPYHLYAITTVVFCLLAVWVSSAAATIAGKKDPQDVVIDEVAGLLVTMAFHPWTWTTAIVGYVAFRLFDTWKPFPCKRFEKFPSGWGIVLDDVMAGVYANIVVWVVWGIF
ncbi:MAG: phosphatidylglycerophosphatase A [Deltaproteobacteria bacterium]|nr:phosphatidylglycerophosphatase A [Deltaproteobacteria bacterium]